MKQLTSIAPISSWCCPLPQPWQLIEQAATGSPSYIPTQAAQGFTATPLLVACEHISGVSVSASPPRKLPSLSRSLHGPV